MTKNTNHLGVMEEKALLLIVDDMPSNLRVLNTCLAQDYHVAMAHDGESALEIAQKKHPTLILLDIMMPGIDGFEVCTRLKDNPATASIPIIFLTGLHEEEFEIRGLELGAADYIHRPFNTALVRLRIATHLQASRASVALRERNIALEYQAQAVHQRADALEQGARQREDIDRVLRHDLKGPLSPIIGFADLMLEDDNLTADQIENLHIIRDAGHRILGMIQRSLDLYKMETHRYRYKPRNENIDRIVGSVMSSMKPLADTSGVALRYSNSDSDSDSTIMFPVEEMLLHLLLSNLTKNAIEASSKGQAVDIEHQLETSKPKAEKLILSVSNPSLVAEDIRTHFFDKYVTTGKSNGTGLGTYSARLMATTMGGKLIMRSAPQVGTRVTLTLPKPKPLSMLYTTG